MNSYYFRYASTHIHFLSYNASNTTYVFRAYFPEISEVLHHPLNFKFPKRPYGNKSGILAFSSKLVFIVTFPTLRRNSRYRILPHMR